MKKLLSIILVAFTVMLPALASAKTVNGVVVDAETGEPLSGATVLPQGSTSGVATNLDGQFSLTVADNVKAIVISYIGYETKTVKAGQDMKIELVAGANVLDDLVVTGYGSAKKAGSIVGSVTVVGEKQFQKLTTPSFTDALQGQVAGLSVATTSGEPTQSAYIRLRGVNSLEAGITPLFILDGAPISSSLFNTLNPADIESISVLKDAASTAIYGSRAANGVIIITSKKGQYGAAAKVELRAQYGFSSMVHDGANMMNSEQYIQMRDLIGMPVSQEARDAWEKYGISTNWRNEIFNGHAPTYDLDASITGGTTNTSYYLGLNHHDQQGIIDQSGMRRESIRFNFDGKIKSWLKVGLQAAFGYNKYETNSENLNSGGIYGADPAFFSRVALPLDSPYYYTTSGGKAEFDKSRRAEYLIYSGRVLPFMYNDYRSQYKKNITGNINLYEQLNPVKGLTIRAQQSFEGFDWLLENKNFPREAIVTPMLDKDGNPIKYAGFANSGSAQKSFQRYYRFTYTNTAEYQFSLNQEHNFSFLVGQESIISKDTGFGAYTSGHTDRRMMSLTQGTTVSLGNLSDFLTETVFNSFFFNLNYNYLGKYYLDATFRRDGSSKFAPGHRWGNFWSVGARWSIAKEDFMKSNTWINSLDLRASYGVTGNSSISDYSFFGAVGSGKNYNGQGTLGISNQSNSDLTWETVSTLDIGINFRIFNQLTGEIAFYDKKTSNMLMSIPYSYTTGFSSGMGNICEMKNTGVEIDLKWDVLQHRDYFLSLKGNVTYNKDRITKLFNGRDSYPLLDYGLCYQVGHSSGEFFTVPYAGVDPADGKQLWVDIDGNLTKTYNEERDSRLIGKSQYAPWFGGFGVEGGWKGISVGADFSWAANKWLLNNDNYFIQNANNAPNYNQTAEMLQTWTTPGQVTMYPAYGEVRQFDSHLIENASYMRLKKLTVQYTLPKALTQKAKIDRVNVFFTGRNLLTFTGFSGYDPEPESNLVRFNYPNTRQFVFGLEVSF